VLAGLIGAYFLLAIPFLPCLAESSDTKYVYDSHGKRDPFVPLVGSDKAGSAESLEEVMSIDDVYLQGVASDSVGQKIAILNGQMIKEGQTIGRVTVKSISQNKVAILIDDREYELNIYETESQ